MTPQPVRRAAKAGTWYPRDPATLAAEVDRYLGRVPVVRARDVTALVAPHAGLVYSGPVAAHAYALLAGRPVDAVVLVGPSHVESFTGVALPSASAFDSPLGAFPVATALGDELRRLVPGLHERPSAHDREHALEMQLPFLGRVLPGVPILPLVMGDQSRATVHELAAALARAWPDRRVLLVASSDLSHYHDARAAAALDGVVTAALTAFDPDALEAALARSHEHACGGGAMAAVMRAARARGAAAARVLCYQDSGDVSGDKSAVVGYVAAAFGAFES